MSENKLKTAVSTLSSIEQALLIFAVSILPPLITLISQQSTNIFLYAAAFLGGLLAFAIKMLGSDPQSTAAKAKKQPK